MLKLINRIKSLPLYFIAESVILSKKKITFLGGFDEVNWEAYTGFKVLGDGNNLLISGCNLELGLRNADTNFILGDKDEVDKYISDLKGDSVPRPSGAGWANT